MAGNLAALKYTHHFDICILYFGLLKSIFQRISSIDTKCLHKNIEKGIFQGEPELLLRGVVCGDVVGARRPGAFVVAARANRGYHLPAQVVDPPVVPQQHPLP